jgi:DNA-binding MarR family transcriptional regulator
MIDDLLAAWAQVRPDLDATPLALVGRILVIAAALEARVEAALEKHSLSLGQFDILATLRRHGPRGGLTPTTLLKSVVLSSGGMTNRLDKLEASGLIVREADPEDRRGVVIHLTAKGRKVIDAATVTRFEDARKNLPPLARSEQARLADDLRVWLKSLAEVSGEHS